MKITEKKLTELTEYKKNPRKNEHAVDAVANSIKTFGFKVPIVIDKNGVIVCGHTRAKAAKKLGLQEVPCIVADDLTPEQIRAFRLADNKVAELAEWDEEALGVELSQCAIDMEAFGFTDREQDETEEDVADVKFSEILGENHNYIVLYFDNDVDWLQALSLFDLKTVKDTSTRADGIITKNRTRFGVGRVLKGAEALNKLTK